jgi:hypothetical protein
MAKINYDSINFKNKDVDKFATKFNKTNGDPKKKEPQGTKNPDWLKGENHKEGVGPYSVGAISANGKKPMSDNYGPKKGWDYVDKGKLTSQDSLDINVNRAPSMNQLELVSKEMKKGTKFPGLSSEFKSALKSYEKLPAKYK